MSEEIKPQESKEVDFLNLTVKMFNSIGKGIRNLSKWVKKQIQAFSGFVWKYFWILALLFVIGGVAGYVKAKLQKPFYETEMLVETQLVSRVQIADRINNLQLFLQDQNYAELSKILNLKLSEAQSIFRIKVDIVNIKVEVEKKRIITTDKKGKEIQQEIEELGPQFMRITIRLWNNKHIPKLEYALTQFIENDPYTQERLKLFRQSNLLQQEAINAEIAQLELFQKKNIEKSSNVMTSGNTPLMVQNEEKTYVKEILDLKNQVLALQSKFELTRPLTVVQPFIVYENPVSRTRINILLFAFLLAGLGCAGLLVREGWKRV